MNEAEQRPGSRGRWTLIGLALLFLGPLALAWLVYFGAPGLRPADNVSHGALIDPPPLLEPLPAVRVGDGAEVEVFRQRWTLFVVADNDCDLQCVDTLTKMRQVHIALGKNMDRLDRVLVLNGNGQTLRGALDDLPGLATAVGTEELFAAIARATVAQEAAADESIFLVDPLGNLMLRLDRDVPPRDLHTDLKRLLRLSRIG